MGTIKRDFGKRTQQDYSLSFKMSVVREVESDSTGVLAAAGKYGIQGHNTILSWRRKYGNFDPVNQKQSKFMQSPQQRIKELERKLRLLERQNNFLSEQLIDAEDKAAIPYKLIDLEEAEYLLPVRKNSLPDQSVKPAKKKGGQL
jgi:transposase-like protein